MTEPLTRQEKARLSRLIRRSMETPSEKLNRSIRDQCRNHGISREMWLHVWEIQAGRCGACKNPLDLGVPRAIQIDHDRSCCNNPTTVATRRGRKWVSCGKCVRGFLCAPCNRGVGMLERYPDRIFWWMDYIRGAKRVSL